MAALDEDDILDDENFQESGFLSFSPEVQAAIDQVDSSLILRVSRGYVFVFK